MITFEQDGIVLRLKTQPELFSPNSIDKGTRAMLSAVTFKPTDKVLDLGCGYGVVGLYAAKKIGADRVTMTDIDEAAIAAAEENAVRNGVPQVQLLQSDGFRQLNETGYSLILSNPPYHSDFSVAKHFIEKGFNRLVLGGFLVMVTKRRDWYRNKLTAIFGGTSIREIDGYDVFIAEKRRTSYAKQKKSKRAQSSSSAF